jgi:hypothetical protein
MRTLKVIVVVMGLLILIGVTVLGVTIAKRMGGESPKTLPLKGAFIPQGFHIKSLATHDNRLVIHLKSDVAEKVMVINLSNGETLYRLESQP